MQMQRIADAGFTSDFATLVVGSFLYGIVTLLFISNLYFLGTRRTLAGKRRSRKQNLTSLAFLGVTALFLVVTAHWTIVVYRGYLEFLSRGNPTLEEKFYNTTDERTQVVIDALFLFSILLGDLLLVYRLWIIWGGHWRIIILPLCAMIAATVVSIMVILQTAQLLPSGKNIANLDDIDRNVVFGNNLYCTAAIVYRVLRATMDSHPENRLMGILTILVESAALQMCWFIILGVAARVSLPVALFTFATFPAITAVTNLLIHARVGLGWSQEITGRHKDQKESTRKRSLRVQNLKSVPSKFEPQDVIYITKPDHARVQQA
ncbi:hypothetical protein FB45DRAFT_922421 [Roridomyces roridus]|uniref:Uncharacterized protein n=1 Tax=Roridomyces roridus TaxID=1738132 RepID=A0AAD7BN35_9AGAR|nr:hypothetical protein FB45DRAFT_922421 [Roridomyces roridus]